MSRAEEEGGTVVEMEPKTIDPGERRGGGRKRDHEEDEKKHESCYVDNLFNLDEMYKPDFYRALFAEFLATQFFVALSLAGTKGIEDILTGGAATLVIVLYHGLLILIVIYATAHLSGAHFNPAMSLGTLLCKRITLLRFGAYVFCQFLGAIAGAGFIKLAIDAPLSYNKLGPDQSAGRAFFFEMYCTFGLVFGAFATAFDPRGWGVFGPIAIACIAMLNILAGVATGGVAMNPFRALAPAIWEGDLSNAWVWTIGSFLGASLGAVTYEYSFMRREHPACPKVPSTAGSNHLKHEHTS